MDFGARMYDAQLGRWHVVDPLADVFVNWSSYTYAYNSPNRFTDPMGMANEDRVENGDGEVRRTALEYKDGAYQFGVYYSDNSTGSSSTVAGCFCPNSIGEEISRNGRNERPKSSNQSNNKTKTESALQGDPVLNKDKFSSFEKALVAINEWNPLANAWDAISGYLTGKDRFGDPITNGEATWKAASIIPIGKVLKIGKLVVRSEALTHIFRNAAGHVNPATATSQFRYLNLFSNVASNPANLVKTVNTEAAKAGVQTFMQTFNNGTVWVQVRNGVIFDAGVNLIP
jgi:hypothetical protein